MKSLSCVRLFATPWTVAHQPPLSMGFSRQEYWSGLPFPSLGALPNPGIESRSPALQADSLPSETPRKPKESQSVTRSDMPDSLRPHGPKPARLLCPWNSPGNNTRVGRHSLLQGIFPTHESNWGLLNCRRILYQLSYQREAQR